MHPGSADTSGHDLFGYSDSIDNGPTGWHVGNGAYPYGGLQQGTVYGQGYANVDNLLDARRQAVNMDASSTSRERRHSRKHQSVSEEHSIPDERRDVSTEKGDGYYRSAVAQNEVPSPPDSPHQVGAQHGGYSASTHSDPWSVTDTVRPRAGSFGKSLDETQLYRRGDGKMRQTETHYWMGNDRLERSKDELRGILLRVPKQSRPSRSSRDRYPTQIAPEDLVDRN